MRDKIALTMIMRSLGLFQQISQGVRLLNNTELTFIEFYNSYVLKVT
jgi:hypothetical protein